MPKRFPSDERTYFLICEDVRIEEGGKFTIIGGAGGGEIHVPEVPKVGAVLSSLTFLLSFTDGEGDFVAEVELQGPMDKPFPKPRQVNVVKQPNGYMNVVHKVAPFPVVLGIYTVSVSLDGTPYSRQFQIKVGSPSPVAHA
jgi:Family of unknown function (DUF6941)